MEMSPSANLVVMRMMMMVMMVISVVVMVMTVMMYQAKVGNITQQSFKICLRIIVGDNFQLVIFEYYWGW